MRIIYRGKQVEAPTGPFAQMGWGMFKLLLFVFAALKGILTGQLFYDHDAEDDIPYDVYPIEEE